MFDLHDPETYEESQSDSLEGFDSEDDDDDSGGLTMRQEMLQYCKTSQKRQVIKEIKQLTKKLKEARARRRQYEKDLARNQPAESSVRFSHLGAMGSNSPPILVQKREERG